MVFGALFVLPGGDGGGPGRCKLSMSLVETLLRSVGRYFGRSATSSSPKSSLPSTLVDGVTVERGFVFVGGGTRTRL